MILTDTHTHLYYETDKVKRKEMIDRCLENRVSRLFLPNVDLESVNQIIELTSGYPDNCYPMLGLHPCEVKEGWADVLASIKQAGEALPVVAVGEIGIDLYWDKTTLACQQDAFHAQLNWAVTTDLPVVIHCRDAFDEVYEVLQQHTGENLGGIFHCFTGSAEQARKIIDLGFYLGIGGVVTYKNSGLDKTVTEIPLENIVLETDSPYLSPVPFRGKPNQSSYLTYIAEKVATLKNISVEQLAEITTENSKKIFKV